MTEKQKLAYARKWRHYLESLMYVECLAHGIKKTPYLEIEEDKLCFQQPGKIHLGTCCCICDTKEELFTELLYYLGHEMQHLLSTTDKDWTAAQKLCFNTAIQKLSIKVFGKTRRLSKDSDYEAFFKDLASKGVFVNQRLLMSLIHLTLNIVEDGRIENIRSRNHPGFAFYRKVVGGRFWQTTKVADVSGGKDVKDLSGPDKFKIVTGQLLFLSLIGMYQSDFIDCYGGTSLHKFAESLIPYISKAVLGKTCKDAMDNGRYIFDKMIDWVLEICTVEADAKELEQILRELLQMLLDEAENSKMSATPNTEEKGDGVPAESLFGQTELETELTEEEYEEMLENAPDGELEQPSVRIKVKAEDETSQDDETDAASKTDTDSSEGESKSEESQSESDGDKRSSDFPASKPTPNPDSVKYDEDGIKLDSKGHNARSSSAGTCADPKETAEKVKQEMEAAAEVAKGDFELAEADAALDEKFRAAADNYSAVEPESVDLSDVNSSYDEDVMFEESVRAYIPTGRLPLELENKGKSLHHKVEELVKNKQDPDQRFLNSGMLDTRRLTNLAMGDLNVFKKKGEKNKTDVAAYLLMDNSGSMGDGPGSTRFACCNAFAVLEEGFKKHMPLKIAAFDASGTSFVSHEVIKEFDEVIEPNLSFNFRDLGRSGNGNKDGYSIRVATRQLLARPEKDKILIIASDGLPTDYRGGSKEGCSDVKAAVAEARKSGIRTIGMYMYHEQSERDFAKYQDMYGPEIIFASLDEIEDVLARILKRYF